MTRKLNGNSPQIVDELVRRMRQDGRTKIALARSAGISERQVYYLMSGRNKNVGADILIALADVLGCEVVLRKARVAQDKIRGQ
jgi:DNA-binding Xre family transcriptional regulator